MLGSTARHAAARTTGIGPARVRRRARRETTRLARLRLTRLTRLTRLARLAHPRLPRRHLARSPQQLPVVVVLVHGSAT